MTDQGSEQAFPRLKVWRKVNAPAAIVWQLLTDTACWPQWGPSVADVECFDCREGFITGGTKGRVKTVLGFWVPFEVTGMEPGRYWGWRVAGIRATGHKVEPLGRHQCRVVFEIPVAAFAYAPVCFVAAGRIAMMANRRQGMSSEDAGLSFLK